MKTFLITSTFLGALLLLSSCKSGGPAGPDVGAFDQQAMLANWADNIILPSYNAFAETTAQLNLAAGEFSADPSLPNLEALRSSWNDAYMTFQRISMFEIGKAAELFYRDNLNTYPTDTEQSHDTESIQTNIESGTYNLELPALRDTQGFPALDYLIYGLGESDEEILQFYTTHGNATGYQTYITDLTDRIHTLTNDVLTSWQESYRDAFVNNSGTGANASVDMMVNSYIFYYEKHLRAGKVGNPAGVFSPTPLPDRIEAYYNGSVSRGLLLEALDAVKDFFNGTHYDDSGSGESLKSYLDYLNTMKQGFDLATLINNQFDSAISAAEDLDNDFRQQIETDNAAMLTVYDQLQLNVVHMKTDMMQALNIAISYTDTDGD